MDGGVRRGSDVAKAVALGARAVLIGRPWAYGLAAAGEPGVVGSSRSCARSSTARCGSSAWGR